MSEFFSQIFSFIQAYHVILFYVIVGFVLYLNRKRFEVQGGFVFLYRTKIGLKLMDSISKRFNRTVKFLATIGIYVGYVGFVVITFALFQILYSLIRKPDVVGVSPVIPGVPIAGTGMVFPLVIGWIALLIIIAVHEFSHGVVARAYNLKILSSGFAFFGPIMGAFVEPDEKQVSKKSEKIQNSIYAAGPFSNVLLTVVALVFLLFAMPLAIESTTSIEGISIVPLPNGAAENASMEGEYTLLKVNGVDVHDNLTIFYDELGKLNPDDRINLETKEGDYTFNIGAHPQNETRGYVGISIAGMKRVGDTQFFNYIYKVLEWLSELLFWVAFISINIALINLYPIYITDGARMLKIMLETRMRNKKKANDYWIKLNNLALFLLISIILIQLFNWVTSSYLF